MDSMVGRKQLKIKSNLACLTKKYANYLFKSYNLQREKDDFSKEHFFSLIQEHPGLFNVYLSGFHTYIWQVGDNDEPEYFRVTPWIESPAVERYRHSKGTVFLKFIQKTIFVMFDKKIRIPKDIINLEGLTVDLIEIKNEARE